MMAKEFLGNWQIDALRHLGDAQFLRRVARFHSPKARAALVKAPLTSAAHLRVMVRMVSRPRIRSFVSTLSLYVGAALIIGYFWAHAHSGDHGLKAKQDLVHQAIELTDELDELRRERAAWEHRVALLRPNAVDPDLLEERARAQLDYTHPRDLVLKRR
jgi:cell division protein FtsB